MKRRLKDFKYLEATIKVWKIREVWKKSDGLHSYKDRLREVKVSSFRGNSTKYFPDTPEGNQELIEFIKYELNIQ